MVRIKWKLKERQIYKLFIKIQSRNHRIYITVMAFFLGFFKGKKSVFFSYLSSIIDRSVKFAQ